jgi:hypothetical protein
MTSNSMPQKSPYLRNQRLFPNEDVKALSNENDRAYIDIATKVNDRRIGIFAVGNQLVTGESWYLTPQKQQTLCQVYQFTATGNVAHGLNFATITSFTKCQGSFTDGTNHYGAIYASNTVIAGQVSFDLTPTNIVIQAGAGAPSITSGIIILEWLSQV